MLQIAAKMINRAGKFSWGKILPDPTSYAKKIDMPTSTVVGTPCYKTSSYSYTAASHMMPGCCDMKV